MVTLRVGNQRLLALAKFLRTIPRKRFDYADWTGDDWKGAPDLSCGTTACALGWATTMPRFLKLGLRLEEGWVGGIPALATNDGTKYGSEAAQVVFGLTSEDANHLFFPKNDWEEKHAGPKYVARKIEKFVQARAA